MKNYWTFNIYQILHQNNCNLCLDLANLRKEVTETLLMYEINRRDKREALLIAFGALTVLTTGDGIAI